MWHSHHSDMFWSYQKTEHQQESAGFTYVQIAEKLVYLAGRFWDYT